MSGLLLVGWDGEIKKAGTRVVGWNPDFFSGDGVGHLHIPTNPARRGDRGDTIPHSNTPHHTISPHIDEDALEGLYFAFYPIHVLLPYFSPYRRPRGSCELLEAFLPSCGECHTLQHPHPTLQHPILPISPHIDEDALEGLYFAF